MGMYLYVHTHNSKKGRSSGGGSPSKGFIFGEICFFLSFFFGFQRHNLITGLSGLQAPNHPLRTQEPIPDRRTGALISLWQTQSNPRLVGKIDHNFGELACILGLTNFHNQRP